MSNMLHFFRLTPWTLVVAVLGTTPAHAECMATGYLKGTVIPQFAVRSKESLTGRWQEYARAESGTEVFPDNCLVRAERIDTRDAAFGLVETLVLDRSCQSLEIGRTYRLVVYRYCRESFDGRPADFFSTLPYMHATVTSKERI